jgi:hypothetical protein
MRRTVSFTLCATCLVALAAYGVAARLTNRSDDPSVVETNVATLNGADDGVVSDPSERNETTEPEQDWRRGDVEPIRSQSFDVEVLVKGYPLEQYPANGRVYVEARAGAEYSLRVRNPLPVRVAVALAVDGLNTIDASRTTARDASKWIIEPYGTITITGWQMSRTRARRFYFTSEQDSYATKLGRAEDVGVISAVFFRERVARAEVEPPRPHDYESQRDKADRRAESQSARSSNAPAPASNSAGAASEKQRAASRVDDDDYAATGIGRSVGNDVRWVNLDLERDPAADVTIRYEYRNALVRLGVVPQPVAADPDPLRRRERARGFKDPRYCPEP